MPEISIWLPEEAGDAASESGGTCETRRQGGGSRSVRVRMNNFGYLIAPRWRTSEDDFLAAVREYLCPLWQMPFDDELAARHTFEKVLRPWGDQVRCWCFNSQAYRTQVFEKQLPPYAAEEAH